MTAPAELPFAPRPYSAELLSSWLMRVAAANLTSLRELLDGFEARYGQVLTNVPMDYVISEAAVTALSQFCRMAPEKIRALDLRERVRYLNPALLLRYHQDLSLLWCPQTFIPAFRTEPVDLRLLTPPKHAAEGSASGRTPGRDDDFDMTARRRWGVRAKGRACGNV